MTLRDWYRELSPRNKFIIDYFQVFEYMIENKNASPSEYLLDREDFFVSDFDGSKILFKDLIRPLARDIPEELFAIHEWMDNPIVIFRLQIQSEIERLKPSSHLSVVKPKGEKLGFSKEETVRAWVAVVGDDYDGHPLSPEECEAFMTQLKKFGRKCL